MPEPLTRDQIRNLYEAEPGYYVRDPRWGQVQVIVSPPVSNDHLTEKSATQKVSSRK